MDESTDGVTLWAGFVLTLVEPFRGMEKLCAPLFERVRHLDGTPARTPVPIALYNEVSDWIEANMGAASVRSAGAQIGRRAYERLRKERAIEVDTAPAAALSALARSVQETIRDPKRRGWELLDESDASVELRRTQTFNCVMQEGVLLAFVEGTPVTNPRVEHLRCTRRGDPFCEYEVRWLPKRPSRIVPAMKPT